MSEPVMTVVSTSDSQDDVRASVGLPPLGDQPPAAAGAPSATPDGAEASAPLDESGQTAEVPATDGGGAPDAAPAVDAAAPDDADVSDADASDAGKTLSKRKGNAQTRINEIARERAVAARERDEARQETARVKAELEALKAAPTGTPPAPTPDTAPPAFSEPRPKQEDFETFDAFEEAKDTWVAKKARFETLAEIDARDKRVAAERQLEESKRAYEALQQAHNARIRAFKTAHTDYDEIVDAVGDTPMDPLVIGFLTRSKVGPDIAYYLGTHPDELQALSALEDLDAHAAVARIEGRLDVARNGGTPVADPAPTLAAASSPLPPKTPVTRQPAPVTRVGAGHVSAKDPEEMEQAEFNKMRDAQEGRSASA